MATANNGTVNNNGENNGGVANGGAGPFGVGAVPGVFVGETPGNPQSFGPQISQQKTRRTKHE